MPNIEEQTTKYLVENALESTSDFTPEEILTELKLRIIPDNDTAISYTEYRGGIRPTHIPTH